MFAPLSFIMSEKELSNSLTSTFFFDDHFTQLYNQGLRRIREKDDEIYYNSLLKALDELNSLQNESPRKKCGKPDFFAKNQEWLIKKEGKLREKAYVLQEMEERKLEDEKKRSKMAKIAYNLPMDYVGPVKGWKTRFMDFKRRKSLSNYPNPNDFHPQIDDNSRKIANFDSNLASERVEDRLIRKGLEKVLKITEKKRRTENISELMDEKQQRKSRKKHEILDFSERLFNDARIIRENRENLLKSEENRFDFKPKINKFREIARKPLYFIDEKQRGSPGEKSMKKALDSGKWEGFLKRNREIEEKKRKLIDDVKKIKEESEIEGCSFRPEISLNTIKILVQANKQEKSMLERQAEFQKSKQEFQQSFLLEKEQKFNNECTFQPKISKSLEHGTAPKPSPEKLKKPPSSYLQKREKRKKVEKNLGIYKEKLRGEMAEIDHQIQDLQGD